MPAVLLLIYYRTDWPQTASLKAIDYWCGGCYFMVFAALMEYCLVLYLKEGTPSAKDKKKRRSHMAARLDGASRILFPSAFVLFSVLFCIYVSGSSEKY